LLLGEEGEKERILRGDGYQSILHICMYIKYGEREREKETERQREKEGENNEIHRTLFLKGEEEEKWKYNEGGELV
jgi:hypothetical protein